MLWAGVIFAIGAAVTLATAAMILSGHQRHRRSHRYRAAGVSRGRHGAKGSPSPASPVPATHPVFDHDAPSRILFSQQML